MRSTSRIGQIFIKTTIHTIQRLHNYGLHTICQRWICHKNCYANWKEIWTVKFVAGKEWNTSGTRSINYFIIIKVLRIPEKMHPPELDTLEPNLNDSLTRMRWRTNQNIGIFLFKINSIFRLYVYDGLWFPFWGILSTAGRRFGCTERFSVSRDDLS